MLSIGAVIGKSFDVAMVAMLAQVPEEEVASDLHDAQHAKVVWADEDGRCFTFVHDKIRETVLSLLPQDQRRHLHALIAQYWEEHDRGQTFELAYHYSEAGEAARALPYALQAGLTARARHALQLAEKYLRIAESGCDPEARDSQLTNRPRLG